MDGLRVRASGTWRPRPSRIRTLILGVSLLSIPMISVPASPASASVEAPLDLGSKHTCAVLADGTIRCWGDNFFGQLGDGSTTDSAHAVEVPGINTAIQVVAGREHTCALLSDSTVRCWGRDNYGQLGDGNPSTIGTSTVPVLVAGLTGVRRIATTSDFNCALLADTTVRCWGRNFRGTLGDGTEINRHGPVVVSGLTGVTRIAVGWVHACAVLADGTARCWGANSSGELGDGADAPSRPNPVQVLASGSTQGSNLLQDVTSIAAGSAFTCASLEDGTARCWGYNSEGSLGDGTNSGRLNPVEVLASGSSPGTDVLGDVVQITTGYRHACARLADDTVRCWGRNDTGQLGDGTTTDRTNPVTVRASGTAPSGPVLRAVSRVAAGEDHTCTLLADGTTQCWGWNNEGQLGDGTTTDRTNPVTVLASASDPAPLVLPVATTSSAAAPPTPSLRIDCTPQQLEVGSVVTCLVAGGDPGIDILWRASFNPVIAEAGMTLDASGDGRFTFTVPAAAAGEPVSVELVEWTAPVLLGIATGPLPTGIAAGSGPSLTVGEATLIGMLVAAGLASIPSGLGLATRRRGAHRR